MEQYVVNVENNVIVSQPVPLKSYLESNNLSTPPENPILSMVLWGVAVLAIILFLFKSFFIVKQQTVKVIERLGRFKSAAASGLHFKIPFIDAIAGSVDLRITEVSEKVVIKSSDNVFISVPVKVQYRIKPEMVKEAYYILSDAKDQMTSYIGNIVRSRASDMSMEEIFKSKDTFESEVNSHLEAKFSEWGFEIVNVLVDNPIPSQEVIESFDKVISSKRLKEAAENEAEALRIKTVANAKAEAESLTLKANAYVAQRKAIADGMSDIIPQEKLADYLVGIDVRDMVRDASVKGSVIIVPTNYDSKIGDIVASLKAINT